MIDHTIHQELDNRFRSRLYEKFCRIHYVPGGLGGHLHWGHWKRRIIERYQLRFNLIDPPKLPPMACAYLDPMRLRRPLNHGLM